MSDWVSKTMHTMRHRWLCGPLCIWGKLPAHGDFLRRNTTAAHTRDWQNWVTRVWNLRPLPQAARLPRARPGFSSNWTQLEPPKPLPDLGSVPVNFVMQPGVMPFSGRHYVQGVVMASQDQVGRAFPLIVFQQVSPAWMRRTWGAQKPGNIVGSTLPVAGGGSKDQLFWISRLMARTHASDKGWADFAMAVEALDALHSPDWRSLFGAAAVPPDRKALNTLLQAYCDSDIRDAAYGLRGVQQLPWTNWPSCILRKENPSNAFWQQDLRGCYINASDSLHGLWGARP